MVHDPSRLEFLAEASAVLSSSLDYDDTLARVADLTIPRLGDWCVVDLVESDGSVRRVAVACADPDKRELARELRDRYPTRPDRPEGTAKVLATGRAELIREIADDWLTAIAPDGDQLDVLRRLGLRSNILVPLAARGRTIGVLTLATAESGRSYDEADLALAEEVAARAALAVDNARLFREAEESLAIVDTLLATAPIGLAFWDRHLRYVRINETLAALNGRSPQEHVGRTVHEVVPDMGDVVAGDLRRVLETGDPILDREVSGETPAAPGAHRHWLASYYPVFAPGGETIGVGAVVTDVTERRRSEQRLAAQHAVMRILAESPSLDDAAPRILGAVCEALGWDVGVLWLADQAAGVLRCHEFWHVPSLEADAFEALTRRLELPPGAGLPGRVWSARRSVWIPDVTEDEDFVRGDAAVETGLRAAIAFPIVVGGEVRGVVEFFHRRVQEPVANLLRGLAIVGGQIGQFVERKRSDAERTRLLAREHVARAEAEEAQQRLAFLAEASAVLTSSLDYEATLGRIARLVVPSLADWCLVDVLEPDGTLRRLAVAHADPEKVRWAEELEDRYPTDPDSPFGAPAVVRTGEAQWMADIPDSMLVEAARDEEHLRILRELGLRSYMCVPLVARGRILGALMFVAAESGRRYTEADLALAREVAHRAGLAVDNARLYQEAQARAQAANVLAHVGDGVFLLDVDGVITLWNAAAEAITGLRESEVVGRRAAEAIPGWAALEPSVPVAQSPAKGAVRAATLPLRLPDRELWLSVSGVGFQEGTVYAFRDLTEERAVEKMKSDFVSTISHELRTPAAAIFGSAITLRREDIDLSEERRRSLLAVIADEAERLARIVNDVLWASRLDTGMLSFAAEEVDAADITQGVVDSLRVHAPPGIDLVVSLRDDTRVIADPEKLRQVLTNLLDNAVKYSPEGGRVEVDLERTDSRLRIAVRDEGIGIPPSEFERIFEKFYRLDPDLTRGVGGTGLGLYICRELVRRMEGRVWVEGGEDGGSTFVVELPAALTHTPSGSQPDLTPAEART